MKKLTESSKQIFDKLWGTAYKVIGEFSGVNSVVRVSTGVEPWSFNMTSGKGVKMLNAEERLKEAAEFAAFGIASHVLQSIPVKEPVEIAVGQVHDIVGWGMQKLGGFVSVWEKSNSTKNTIQKFGNNINE